MHVKETMIIFLIALAIVVTIRSVRASPDTYYLGSGDVLTTTKPRNSAIQVAIDSGETFTRTWYSNVVGGTIGEGTYTFNFYMSTGHPPGITVHVTFKFGYYKDGTHFQIVEVSSSPVNLNQSIQSYDLSISLTLQVNIPEGSRLYLTVTIYNPTHGNKYAYFYYGGYYSGVLCDTRIEIPSIIVPEFPAGVFTLSPMLLVPYLILRRHLPKLRSPA